MLVAKVTIRFTSGCVSEQIYTDSEVGYLAGMTNKVLFDWLYRHAMESVKILDDEIEDLQISILAD